MSTHAPLLQKAAGVRVRPRAVQSRGRTAARAPEARQNALSGALNGGATTQRLAALRARINDTGVPAQRVLMAGLNPAPGLSTAAGNKLNEAAGSLNLMGANVAPNIVCTLSNINTGGTNPAATTYDAANGRIDIDIENWYLEMASAGELLGMLTHELGVHSLADAEMTGPQIALETASNPAATNIATANANYPIAGQQPIDARQIDHVNAVKEQAMGGLRDRGQRYLDTFLRMGDAVENNPTLNAAERTRRQRDLQDTFLFDIGRIVATDDGGAVRGLAGVPGAVAMASRGIADVMNWYRATYIVPQYGAHAWLNQPALQRGFSGAGVVTMLIDKLVDYGAARIKGASTGTKLMLGAAGVGAVAAGVALAPMTTLALGVGGLAYGAYRWFTG